MKKSLRRLVSLASAAALSVAALGMFAGCTTNHPEVTITYAFNGKTYEVDYVLSRNDAPRTVQHFIELADAGFYDGLCVHDYDDNFLYTGGYRLEDNELVEIDYLTRVKELEEEKGIRFTQSVFTTDNEPLYAVYGEFEENGNVPEYGRENRHSTGALVMYYTDKGKYTGDVSVLRNDGGKENGGEQTQRASYRYNSTTSLFYTFVSPAGTRDDLQKKYTVFGMAKDFEGQITNGLMQGIADYLETLGEDESFTTEQVVRFNTYDYFEDVRTAGLDNAESPFNTPIKEPIVVQSVKVTKY